MDVVEEVAGRVSDGEGRSHNSTDDDILLSRHHSVDASAQVPFDTHHFIFSLHSAHTVSLFDASRELESELTAAGSCKQEMILDHADGLAAQSAESNQRGQDVVLGMRNGDNRRIRDLPRGRRGGSQNTIAHLRVFNVNEVSRLQLQRLASSKARS